MLNGTLFYPEMNREAPGSVFLLVVIQKSIYAGENFTLWKNHLRSSSPVY